MIRRFKILAVAAFGVLLAAPPRVPAAELTGDGAHTTAVFSVKHLTLTTINGSIAVSKATIDVAPDDALSSASATLDLTTIDTKFGQRDDDLKSDHWFDVAKYPTMTFKSTKITGDKSSMTIAGDLTFHGITKPATLAAKFEGKVKDGRGRTHVGYSATTTLDRTQWNLGTNFPPAIVGNDVTVTLELEAVEP